MKAIIPIVIAAALIWFVLRERKKINDIRFEYDNFRVEGQEGILRLKAINPSRVSLQLIDQHYKVTMKGELITESKVLEPVHLAPGETNYFEVPFKMDLGQFAKVAEIYLLASFGQPSVAATISLDYTAQASNGVELQRQFKRLNKHLNRLKWPILICISPNT
jgi:LEA14-like dessication related protein